MATPFTTIFDQFLETEIDDGSFALFTDDLFYKKLSLLLTRSRNKFRDVIIANTSSTTNKASDIESFSRTVYEFTHTGTTFTTTLSPAPATGSTLYVSVNDVETTDFTFNESNNELVVNNLPNNQENRIYVGAYKNGKFNQTLNLTEIGIFVELMGLFYLNDKIKKETLIVHSVYGKDYSLSGTQANHIRSLSELYNERERKAEQHIIMYAFRNFGFRYTVGEANGYLG